MERKEEQRLKVKFCVKLQKSPSSETWCYQYDPEAKRQFMEWRMKNSPRPKKPRMSKSKIKTMLICLFDIRGTIHFESVPKGTTVTQIFYVEVLKRLTDAMRHKRGKLWRDRSLILHHDNAPAYSSLRVSQFLAQKDISAMDHLPYSPDLAPADFWLFPKLKSVMKGKRFSDIEDIKSPVKKFLTCIPVKDFKNCFEQ
jgi:histone-lysine N-methyltransferase SETMAR